MIVDSISRPIKMYYDNIVVVFLAKNNKSGSRSKHIDIKYLALKEWVKANQVVIEHISTKEMLADPLTKGMHPKEFKDLAPRLGLKSLWFSWGMFWVMMLYFGLLSLLVVYIIVRQTNIKIEPE